MAQRHYAGYVGGVNTMRAFTAGVNYSVGKTGNDYDGSTDTKTGMSSNSLCMFAQLHGKLSVINYMAGMGASRSSIHQGDIGYTKWNIRPQLTLSYNFSHGRKYKTRQRKLSNSDNDNGIR